MHSPFRVTADGRPIQDYYIKPGPVHITHSLEYEKVMARAMVGLSIAEFEALPGNPEWCLPGQNLSKCHVLMAYRMNKWIEAAGNEGQRRDMERKHMKPTQNQRLR